MGGIGNQEIVLNREISDKRIFPAIDINKSGTRKEDLLLDLEELNKVWILRKYLADLDVVERIEFLIDKMRLTKNNKEFLMNMNS